MTRYVALLRGIGPATHAQMPLKALATRLAEMGLTDLVNVGNTGNLVFECDRDEGAARAIVTAAVDGFGGGPEVFIRSRRQVQMLVNAGVFPDAQAERPGRLGVCFFHKAPRWPTAWRDFAGPERVKTYSNHLAVDYGPGTGPSRLMVERDTGARMTQRNWSSILRIARAMDINPALAAAGPARLRAGLPHR
jgi:uncharacterized protein (DUF1697 family)